MSLSLVQGCGSRPSTAPSRRHPYLYQPSQRELPESSLKRRYYHLGVCRTVPPPDDRDSTAALIAEELGIDSTTHGGSRRTSTVLGSRPTSAMTKASRPVSAAQKLRNHSRPTSADSTAPNLGEKGKQLSINALATIATESAPIAYRPYSTWHGRKAMRADGTLVKYSYNDASGIPPPAPQVIPTVEVNQHFVQPLKDGQGGTDFSAHFVNRPFYSFQKQPLDRPPSASSAAATDMRRQLWRIQRDTTADWVPSHRPHSAISHTASYAADFVAKQRSMGSGDFDDTASISSSVIAKHRPPKSSMDVVRAASASHATRMLRMERRLKNTVLPPTFEQRMRAQHPNQVYVVL